MLKNVEVLLSVMNIKNEEQYNKILKENNITGQVLAVNQIKNKGEVFNIDNENKRLYSYREIGASRSRNRLLQNALGYICIFADDDMVYNDDYEEIIKDEFKKNENADAIIFYIENKNSKREKIKKIRNKRLNLLNIMRVRTSEIAIKQEAIKKYNVKFNENFGPTGIFKKGEETVFLAECLKKGMNINVCKRKIGYVFADKSSWFTGFNKQYLYDQGAIFYKIVPKVYKLFIFQYIIRKYFLYRKEVNILQAYKQMKAGAKKCKEIYGDN